MNKGEQNLNNSETPKLGISDVMCSFNTAEVINDGCFYARGTILHKQDNGMFAPNIEDYPHHCHFLTQKFIINHPMIFKYMTHNG